MKAKKSSRFVVLFAILFGVVSVSQALHADTTTSLMPQGALPQNTAALGGALASQESQKIEVQDIQGEVYLQKNDTKEPVLIKKNTLVQSGDWVRVKDGTCEVRFNNSKITLYPNTNLEISEASLSKSQNTFSTNLNLQSGRLKIHVDKLKEGSRFEVKTPTAVAAVRGTTFYLYSGVDMGKLFTELYVDESTKGVLLTHLKTLESFLVPHFSSSFASEDGTLLAPHTLTEEEQKAFKDKWEKFLSKFISQQLAIEEFSLATAPPTDPNLSNLISNDGFLTDDANADKNSEQNAFGQSQDGPGGDNSGNPTSPTPQDLKELERRIEGLSVIVADHVAQEEEGADDFEWSYSTVHDFRDYGIVTPIRLPLLDIVEANISGEDDSLSDPDTYNAMKGSIGLVREEERNEMRQEIARIIGDIQFEQADAKMEQVADAQTGKVFTDIHGNRVRVDEYIYHEDGSDKVEMLSLTLRTDGPLEGVSAVHLGVEFNRSFGEGFDIKTLPWNDYFNVVTNTELSNRLNEESNISSEDLASQYIVHEHNPDLAQGDSAIYPTHFFAEFTNPVHGEGNLQDKVRLDEAYGDPQSIFFEGESSFDESYVVQPLIGNSIFIAPANDQSLLMLWHGNQNQPSVYLNTAIAYGQFNESSTKNLEPAFEEGSVSVTLLAYQAQSGAQGPNLTESSTTTSRAFNSYALAYLDSSGSHVKFLTASYVPFNNNGEILNQEGGFEINGLRDLFSPNILVNNGHYNLETMFSYTTFHNNSAETNFQIDAIITPEIFTPESGFNTSADFGSEFPPFLSETETPGQYSE